jgi:hypothetical protein
LALTELNSLGRTWRVDSILALRAPETARLVSKKGFQESLDLSVGGTAEGGGRGAGLVGGGRGGREIVGGRPSADGRV